MTLFNFTIQGSSPLINYSPEQWSEGSVREITNDTCACQYNESSIMTNSSGATAMFSFLGTGISLFGSKGDTYGNYSVQVDQDVFIETGFHETNLFNVSLFEHYGLEYGQHTVVTTNMPAANESTFNLNSISISRNLGPPGYNGTIYVTFLDDTAPAVTYTGEWTQVPSTTAFENTLHLTTQESAQVTVSFQGSSIELYGRYANAPFIAQLDDTPPMSFEGFQVDLAPEQEHPQTLLYLMDSLNENQTHTVTITNSRSNINQPFFFDYAIVRSSKQSNNSTNTSTFLSSSSTRPSSLNRGIIIGSVIGGVLGFLFLAFCGILLVRRYHPEKFFSRLQKYDHHIMPYIVAEFSQRRQNSSTAPCLTNHDSEKVPTSAFPSVSVPPAIHCSEVYGLSPYGTLYTPSTTTQSARSHPAFDDVSQLQRSNSTSTFISTSTSLSSSSYSSVGTDRSLHQNIILPSNHFGAARPSLSPVREEDSGRRVTVSLPPAYNSAWTLDSGTGARRTMT